MFMSMFCISSWVPLCSSEKFHLVCWRHLSSTLCRTQISLLTRSDWFLSSLSHLPCKWHSLFCHCLPSSIRLWTCMWVWREPSYARISLSFWRLTSLFRWETHLWVYRICCMSTHSRIWFPGCSRETGNSWTTQQMWVFMKMVYCPLI